MQKVKPELVFQVGCIVEDVEKTVANLKTYFALEEDSIVFKNTKQRAMEGTEIQNFYNGEPCEFYIKTARLNFGGIDLEYIEPLNKEGGDPYSDWFKAHGPGLHHINLKVDDRPAIDAAMAQMGKPQHIYTEIGGLGLETYDFRDIFGFICELGDMVVGPMAESYNKAHEKKSK